MNRLHAYAPWIVVVLIAVVGVYAYMEMRADRAEAVQEAGRQSDVADSAIAANDSMKAAFEDAIRKYSAYVARAEARRDSLAARADSLAREAEEQGQTTEARTDSLEATLKSILVVAAEPEARGYARYALTQLDSIRTSHNREIRTYEQMVAAKDTVIRSYRRQLAKAEEAAEQCADGWKQCRVALDTTRQALQKWKDIADPGWLESLAQCLPETGAKLAVVGGATLVSEKAGAGAGALLALDMALGGPC